MIAGARAAIPLGLAALPFGLVYGVAVIETQVSPLVGIAASWIVLAGAAQLTLLALIDAAASWPVAVGTALVINARFALYSAALAPAFARFPTGWRYALPYLMTDQAATLALTHYETDDDPVSRRWWYLGAGLLFASGWWSGTVMGVLVGAVIPPSVDIGFAVPAMFIALLVPTLTNRPAVVAAAVGASLAVVTGGLPNGSNLIAGAVAGIAAGAAVLPRQAG